jgi:hypothetical protein
MVAPAHAPGAPPRQLPLSAAPLAHLTNNGGLAVGPQIKAVHDARTHGHDVLWRDGRGADNQAHGWEYEDDTQTYAWQLHEGEGSFGWLRDPYAVKHSLVTRAAPEPLVPCQPAAKRTLSVPHISAPTCSARERARGQGV